MTEDLSNFPVQVTRAVRWGDMDAFGHVNNTVFFRFFEEARIAYFDRLGLMTSLGASGAGPILASTSCRFRRPLEFPDEVIIGARVTNVGQDRFTMQYRIFSRSLRRVAADGEGEIVTFDYEKKRKVDVPETLRTAIAELEASEPAPGKPLDSA